MSEYELYQRIAKLERTVAFLLEKLQIDYVDEPPSKLDPEIIQLLQRGNKIEAIKRYREQTGLGLAEAKRFIDSLES